MDPCGSEPGRDLGDMLAVLDGARDGILTLDSMIFVQKRFEGWRMIGGGGRGSDSVFRRIGVWIYIWWVGMWRCRGSCHQVGRDYCEVADLFFFLE